MNYQVGWLREAENEYEVIWLRSYERDRVKRASEELQRQLEENAGEAGESREPGLRIVFEPPLAMTFWINEDAKRALVLHCWEYH